MPAGEMPRTAADVPSVAYLSAIEAPELAKYLDDIISAREEVLTSLSALDAFRTRVIRALVEKIPNADSVLVVGDYCYLRDPDFTVVRRTVIK